MKLFENIMLHFIPFQLERLFIVLTQPSENILSSLSATLRETPNTSLTSSVDEFKIFLRSIREKVESVDERGKDEKEIEKSFEKLKAVKVELDKKKSHLDYLNEAMLKKSSVR